MEFNDFVGFGDRFSEAKSIKNQLINSIQDGVPQFGFGSGLETLPGRAKTAQDALRQPQKPPKTPQYAANTSPRAVQEAPKTVQEPLESCPRSAQNATQRCLRARNRSRAVQEPPKSRPDPIQTSILHHFEGHFGQFLLDVSRIWEGIWLFISRFVFVEV